LQPARCARSRADQKVDRRADAQRDAGSAAQLGKLVRDHLLRRTAEAQQRDIPAPADASAGDCKPQLRIVRKTARRRQDLEYQVRISGMQRRFGAVRRADDENPLWQARPAFRIQAGEQCRDKVATGDQGQCQPVEPRQRPQDAAVANRQPGRPVDRQQACWLLVRRDHVISVRCHQVAIGRAAVRGDGADDLGLRQQRERQAEKFDMIDFTAVGNQWRGDVCLRRRRHNAG
jgi:hypothetical protein